MIKVLITGLYAVVFALIAANPLANMMVALGIVWEIDPIGFSAVLLMTSTIPTLRRINME